MMSVKLNNKKASFIAEFIHVRSHLTRLAWLLCDVSQISAVQKTETFTKSGFRPHPLTALTLWNCRKKPAHTSSRLCVCMCVVLKKKPLQAFICSAISTLNIPTRSIITGAYGWASELNHGWRLNKKKNVKFHIWTSGRPSDPTHRVVSAD